MKKDIVAPNRAPRPKKTPPRILQISNNIYWGADPPKPETRRLGP